MATYVGLIQFTDQGIRNIKDTVKRGDAAIAEAEKMGLKIVEEFWTMGAYDAVVVFEAPDDETMSAFMLKIGSLGNVKKSYLARFPPERDGRHSGEDQIAFCDSLRQKPRRGPHVARTEVISLTMFTDRARDDAVAQ